MLLSVVLAVVFSAGYGLQERASAEASQPNYTSRVPKYTFADTLEGQEAQLKVNPLMQRLIASRRKQAGDRYRPI